MAIKADLRDWVLDALRELGGSGSILDISKHVWEHHESDLKESGDLFFTWQYDMRWAGLSLRKDGLLAPTTPKSSKPWTLARAKS